MDQQVQENPEGRENPGILVLLAIRGHLFRHVLYLLQQEHPFLLSDQQHPGSLGSPVCLGGLETLVHP